MIDEKEVELIVVKATYEVEKNLISRLDERYVIQNNCNERQEIVNKKFANDDKRIEIISHDFSVIKNFYG